MKDSGKGQKLQEQIPPGGIKVGDRIMYPDLKGNLQRSPQDAIRANMDIERDMTRGTSGGCGQDPDYIPYQGDFGIGSDR